MCAVCVLSIRRDWEGEGRMREEVLEGLLSKRVGVLGVGGWEWCILGIGFVADQYEAMK